MTYYDVIISGLLLDQRQTNSFRLNWELQYFWLLRSYWYDWIDAYEDS